MNYGTSRQCVQIPLKVMFLHLMMEKCDVCLSGEKEAIQLILFQKCVHLYIFHQKKEKPGRKHLDGGIVGVWLPPPPTETLVSSEI